LSIFPSNLDTPEISAFIKNSLHIVDVCAKTGIARGYRLKLVNKVREAVIDNYEICYVLIMRRITVHFFIVSSVVYLAGLESRGSMVRCLDLCR
jgi:hypothetical protein